MVKLDGKESEIIKNLLYNFYTTERNGNYVSDGGGPFGFDIHHALEIDYLISRSMRSHLGLSL